MRFALRAMELTQPYHKKDIEGPILKILARAQSNIPEHGTGEDIFNKFVRPSHPTQHAYHERRPDYGL